LPGVDSRVVPDVVDSLIDAKQKLGFVCVVDADVVTILYLIEIEAGSKNPLLVVKST
jgi:hypothetical protein